MSLLRAWTPFTLCHPLLLRLSLDMVGMECLGPAFARPVSRLMAVLLLPLGECVLVPPLIELACPDSGPLF